MAGDRKETLARLTASGVCFVTDRKRTRGRNIQEVVLAACRGGVGAIQLREKDLRPDEFLPLAAGIAGVCRQTSTVLIINSDLQAAAAVGADGVHLPGTGLDIQMAREVCGTDVLIGRSVRSVAEALAAEREGADYIQVGTIFPTICKPGKIGSGLDLIRETSSRVSIPILAVGGINSGNLEHVLEAGAAGISVVSAISEAEDIETATRGLVELVRAGRRQNDRGQEVLMKITVNGKEREVPEGVPLTGFLASFDINPRRVVVELNGEILPRGGYDGIVLNEGDVLEVVHFVGGGCE